jgi:hypothetical protein
MIVTLAKQEVIEKTENLLLQGIIHLDCIAATDSTYLIFIHTGNDLNLVYKMNHLD